MLSQESALLVIANAKAINTSLALLVFHTGRQKLGFAPRYYLLVQDSALACVSCAPCCSGQYRRPDRRDRRS